MPTTTVRGNRVGVDSGELRQLWLVEVITICRPQYSDYIDNTSSMLFEEPSLSKPDANQSSEATHRACGTIINSILTFQQYNGSSATMNCGTFVKRNFTETGIHGLPYLIRKDLHWTERLFWLGIVISATYYSIFICLDQMKRFRENPIVFAAELTWDKRISFMQASQCAVIIAMCWPKGS
ncbi:unnamed protein product [Ceratitis capitata]|uniref:(Mediterranean fruit fly) hypothetical protein n=1 Tax=Ceratitis capitata TaxID=7213 RepID=A0A811VG66_CERCA|nr:unnamed protein product [Ceratitis capitata]